MTATELAGFALILAAAAAVPGPDIAAIVARSLGGGFRRAMPLILGITAGHAIWLAAAVTGLAMLAKAFGAAFIAVKIVGVLYLLYLAWQLWRAPVEPAEEDAANRSGDRAAFLAGFLVSLSNPKALVFFGAVVPAVLPVHNLEIVDIAALTAVNSVTLITVFACWAMIAARARVLLRKAGQRRVLNRVSAAVMAGTGIAVAAR